VCSSYVWQDASVSAGLLMMTYLLGSSISRRTGMMQRPLALRGMLYSLVAMFGGTLHVTVTDIKQHYRDNSSDLAAAKLGPQYAAGGILYYEKMLARNRALRRLNTESGDRLYTAYGNEKQTLRAPRVPLTERLEALREYCEKHHPATEGSAEGPTSGAAGA